MGARGCTKGLWRTAQKRCRLQVAAKLTINDPAPNRFHRLRLWRRCRHNQRSREIGMQMRSRWMGTIAIVASAWSAAALAQSEVAGAAGTTSAKAMPSFTSVTPAMLDGAGADAKNWIHPNGSYAQTRYYPGTQ